eukprot:242856_1
MGSTSVKPRQSDDACATHTTTDNIHCTNPDYSKMARALSSLDPETLKHLSSFDLGHLAINTTIDPCPSDQDDVLDAVDIAVDVMTAISPDTQMDTPTLNNPYSVSSRSIATCFNSEIIENYLLASNSNLSSSWRRSPILRRRSSNLIRASDAECWDMHDLDEVAFEMRCQMRLLRSLSPPYDSDLSNDSSYESDDDQSSDSGYKSESESESDDKNARLIEQFRLTQIENTKLTKILKQQRRQIEELQQATQQMQQTD